MFFVSGIVTGNETDILSYVLGASLDICVSIISIFNSLPRESAY